MKSFTIKIQVSVYFLCASSTKWTHHCDLPDKLAVSSFLQVHIHLQTLIVKTPSYLQSLLTIHKPNRSLRSSDLINLLVPKLIPPLVPQLQFWNHLKITSKLGSFTSLYSFKTSIHSVVQDHLLLVYFTSYLSSFLLLQYVLWYFDFAFIIVLWHLVLLSPDQNILIKNWVSTDLPVKIIF